MSHLLAPQEEKKDSRASQSAPAVSDTSFLVPPQEQKSGQTFKGTANAHLVPPQEEKADVAALRGEQARLDQALGRMQDQMNKRRVEQDSEASLGPAGDKQQRDSVLSGAAGVTGEDLGVAENQRLV